MKKNKGLRFIQFCVFMALLCCVLAGVSRLVERKASTNQFGPFLENPQEYDVLFFGDSCFVNCLYPMELWDDYGLAGYNLSCYGSTMPVTYWSVMNALNYASPKLVVVAVNGVRKDLKVTGSSSDVHTAFDFYPLSLTKIRAIEDLMSDPYAVDDEGNRYADMKWEYYFTLGKYHSRWSELVRSDFVGNPNVQKGAGMMVGVNEMEEYEIIDDNLYADETGYGYAYLRMLIEKCQSRGIGILLVHPPYIASENAQRSAHTVSSIAEEYGVNYVDFVQLDSVTDYAVDCYDGQDHLNPSGGQKVTDYLGQYIVDHYDIPDRRLEEGYAHWAQERDAYVDFKIQQMQAFGGNLRSQLMLLHDRDFDVRLALRPDAPVYYDEQAILLMHNIAREHVFEENEYSMWSNAMYPLSVFDEAIWENAAYFLSVQDGEAQELMGKEAEAAAQATFGASDAAMLLQVIDRRTGEPCLTRSF